MESTNIPYKVYKQKGNKEMKMTLSEAFEMIDRGETPEQYHKRITKIRRLYNKKYDLEDAIEVLGDDPRAEKKIKRLEKVNETLAELI